MTVTVNPPVTETRIVAPGSVTLEMSVAEAVTLVAVLSKVGGSGIRHHAEKVLTRLNNAGISISYSDPSYPDLTAGSHSGAIFYAAGSGSAKCFKEAVDRVNALQNK